MDAPVRGRASETGFVAGAVDVNVARERIDVLAAIEIRFESFEPKDACGDGRIRFALPSKSNGLATFENGADRPASSDLLRDSVQSQRSAIRASRLPDAETRGRAAKGLVRSCGWFFWKREMLQCLFGDGDSEEIACGGDTMLTTAAHQLPKERCHCGVSIFPRGRK